MSDFWAQLTSSDSDARREQVAANAAAAVVSNHTLLSTRTGSVRRTETIIFERAFTEPPTFTTGGGPVGAFTPIIPPPVVKTIPGTEVSPPDGGGGINLAAPSARGASAANLLPYRDGLALGNGYISGTNPGANFAYYDFSLQGPANGQAGTITYTFVFQRVNVATDLPGGGIRYGNPVDFVLQVGTDFNRNQHSVSGSLYGPGTLEGSFEVAAGWDRIELLHQYFEPVLQVQQPLRSDLVLQAQITTPFPYEVQGVRVNLNRFPDYVVLTGIYDMRITGPDFEQAGEVLVVFTHRRTDPAYVDESLALTRVPAQVVVACFDNEGHSETITFRVDNREGGSVRLATMAGWTRLLVYSNHLGHLLDAADQYAFDVHADLRRGYTGGDGQGEVTITTTTAQLDGHLDPIVTAAVTEWVREGLLYVGAKVATTVLYPGVETTTVSTSTPVFTPPVDPGAATLAASWLRAPQGARRLEDPQMQDWVSAHAGGVTVLLVPDSQGRRSFPIYNSISGGSETTAAVAQSVRGRFDVFEQEPEVTVQPDTEVAGTLRVQIFLLGVLVPYTPQANSGVAAWQEIVEAVATPFTRRVAYGANIVEANAGGTSYLMVEFRRVPMGGYTPGVTETTLTAQAGQYASGPISAPVGQSLPVLPLGMRIIMKGHFPLSDPDPGPDPGPGPGPDPDAGGGVGVSTGSSDVAIHGRGQWRHWLQFSGTGLARPGRAVAAASVKELPARAPGVGEMTGYVS